MGNQLSATVPSQILPVDHYIEEIGNVVYEKSLGSTRFFKVARAKGQEGDIVIKVFVVNDPSLPLNEHQSNLEVLLSVLTPQWGCLPFQKAMLTDKAVLLFRQYVHTSAYDRISTRPFLMELEKKWIFFQVLKALSFAHTNRVCHGDIKLENIMLTSFSWVLLTDFASYKPAYIPEDNPTDFTYFFDTSRRRVCYIAPERFRSEGGDRQISQLNSQSVLDQGLKGELNPAMDIFSAGCALTELWTEGVPPFTLASLLAFRSGGPGPEHALEKVEDLEIREVLKIMMARDPSDRMSAYHLLGKYKGVAFPGFFDHFYKYFQIIADDSCSLSDERMKKFHKDLPHLMDIFKRDSGNTRKNNGCVIFLTLVTANIRSLKMCENKLRALDILEVLFDNLCPELICDRVLPYLFILARDRYPAVRGRTVKTLLKALRSIDQVRRPDRNIFPDYILPELAQLVQDESSLVRFTFAMCVTDFANLSSKFLGDIYHESTQELEVIPVTPLTPSSPMWTPHVDYDTELNNLQESFQKIVTSLLTDLDNHVKRGLVENGISQLCIFFGKQRANDVILSHMITFLNDKTDHQLRSSFFKAIVGVAAYIGWTCSTLLKPLLQQGLSDPEEYVIVNAIDAISGLAQLGLFQKPTLFEMVNEVAPLLVHPNSWIRMSAARFLSICARLFNAADVYGRLAKILKPFLKKQIISMESEFLLLYLAYEPIPRPVFDSIVRLPKLKEFLDTLEKRKIARASGRELDLSNTEAVAPMKNIFGRLVAEGMTKQTEILVLLLKDHLKKLHGHREATVAQKKITLADLSGVLNLNLMKMLVPVYSADLCSLSSAKPTNSQKEKPIVNAPETPIVLNREWEKMLGVHHRRVDDEEGIAIATDVTSEEGGFNDSEISSKGTLLSMEDSVLTDSLVSSHHQRLQEYISLKSAEYLSTMDSFDLSSRSLASRNIPSKWRPKAVLVAHLQEHSKTVNRLVTVPDTSFFASASSDGTVKLFDAIRFEANTVANRSRQTYDRCNGDPVTSLTASKDKLLLATEKGYMQVLSLENSRLIMSQSRQLDENKEGGTVDVSYCPSNHGNIFAYATTFGDIIGWDLRTPGIAWRLKHSLKDGVITCLCNSYDGLWLGSGSCDGTYECWDLRFHLNVVHFKHPTGCRVRKIMAYPTQSSWFISSVQANNEISIWDWESKTRQQAFWSSNAPLLSQSQVSNQMTLGLSITLSPSDSSGFLLSCGTDQRVRYWDLGDSTQSYVLIANQDDTTNQVTRIYSEKLVDGTRVVQESSSKPRAASPPAIGLEEINPAHRDIINNIIAVKGSQPFVVTSSMDGIIKVWK